MGARLGVVCAGGRSVHEIASHSRGALDRPLRCPAELWVAVSLDRGVLRGAFQRRLAPSAVPSLRRGSGGPSVCVGEGTVHVSLALAHPGVLWPADARRIVNRSVRPLLRALNQVLGVGHPAHFFGRDWVSVAHQPAAWVGFAHDATTRRTAFEAFVAVRAPFADEVRASLRGKASSTLEAIAGRRVDSEGLLAAIVAAYGRDAEPVGLDPLATEEHGPRPGAPDGGERIEPPWRSTAQEAIGEIGAGPDAEGVFRVGGDLLVSRDALARLEASVPSARREDIGTLVDRTLGEPGVALDGVKSLASLRDVIIAALDAP